MPGPGPPPAPSRHAAIRTLVALGLTIALITLVVALRRSARRWQSNPSAPPAASATRPAATLPSLERLVTSAASDFAAMQPGGEPLPDEPAGLPTPQALVSSPSQVSRLAGFRRRQERVAEEVAIWSIRGASAEAVDRYYRDAAAQLHFMDQRAPTTAHSGAATADRNRTLSRLMVRTAPPPGAPRATAAPQSLIISIRPVSDADGELRITLWLRYPIMQP